MNSWFLFAALALICWGVVGLFQKLSTNYLSSGSALVWLAVGYFLFLPLVYPHESLAAYSKRSLLYALLGGVLNALASWALLAAMRNGGKASIVGPFTALYPLVVVLAAPAVLSESLTWLQGLGVACALAAGVLLAE